MQKKSSLLCKSLGVLLATIACSLNPAICSGQEIGSAADPNYNYLTEVTLDALGITPKSLGPYDVTAAARGRLKTFVNPNEISYLGLVCNNLNPKVTTDYNIAGVVSSTPVWTTETLNGNYWFGTSDPGPFSVSLHFGFKDQPAIIPFLLDSVNLPVPAAFRASKHRLGNHPIVYPAFPTVQRTRYWVSAEYENSLTELAYIEVFYWSFTANAWRAFGNVAITGEPPNNVKQVPPGSSGLRTIVYDHKTTDGVFDGLAAGRSNPIFHIEFSKHSDPPVDPATFDPPAGVIDDHSGGR